MYEVLAHIQDSFKINENNIIFLKYQPYVST